MDVSADPETPDPARKSVFAKLPDSRPGTRSPRRRPAAGGDGSAADTAPATGQAAEARPELPRPARPAAEHPVPPPEVGSGTGPMRRAPRSLEDAAWAGIAVAAEAATIGVRLANRALEALRDAGERR